LKISIITVTFNSSSFINHCLDSIKKQTYNNIEHIVIDGGSSEDNLSILKSKKDQLSALISEPDNGIYDAMNKGLKIAKGDIIGFLNSDDFYATNDVLNSVYKLFKDDPTLDACYSDLVYVNALDTSKIIRYWKSGNFIQGTFSKGWCPPHPTFFVRRSIYERFGNFNLNYHIAADVELMIRFLEVHKINFRYLPEVWIRMRLGGTTNKNLKNIYRQNIEVLNALKFHGLKANWFYFFLNKIISRTLQFLRKSNK
jgi:glycosyltransferase involved in cell wall biosynthesis